MRREAAIARAVGQARTYDDAFWSGVRARKAGRAELAAALLEKAVTFERTTAARIALAGAYRDLKRTKAAIKLCRQVLREEPENEAAKVVLAALYRDEGSLNAGYALDAEVLKANPSNTHAMKGLSGIHSDLGHPERAHFWMERAEIPRPRAGRSTRPASGARVPSPAVSKLYDHLGQVARLGAITSYQELDAEGYAMTTPDLRDRLDDVALLCHSRKQPLLPALVVNLDWQIPDPHFFEVAARCGVYRGTAEPERMRRWWDRYAKQVWLYWRGAK